MNKTQRLEIVKAFSKVMEKREYTTGSGDDLPYPKILIREALTIELIQNKASNMLEWLEAGLLHLDEFIPTEEHDVIVQFESFVKEANSETTEDIKKIAEGYGELYTKASVIYEKIKNKQEKTYKQIINMRNL